MAERIDLAVDLGRGLRLRSPVLVASGTFGYGFDAPQVDRAALGAIVTKGTTLRSREGNMPNRIAETPSGMLNAIGLQNPGVDHVVGLYAPVWTSWNLPVIVNVAGDAIEEYVAVARRLEGVAGIAGLELNISCPNVANGLQFGVERDLAAELTSAVRAVTRLPLIVKLTPNVAEPAAVAVAAEEGGADAVALINTLKATAIDPATLEPWLGAGRGGLSGPAIRALALEQVRAVADAISIPIVGMGGIESGAHALEFLVAGANAVAVGTASFRDALAGARVRMELETALERAGATSVPDLRSRFATSTST